MDISDILRNLFSVPVALASRPFSLVSPYSFGLASKRWAFPAVPAMKFCRQELLTEGRIGNNGRSTKNIPRLRKRPALISIADSSGCVARCSAQARERFLDRDHSFIIQPCVFLDTVRRLVRSKPRTERSLPSAGSVFQVPKGN
jgi:hypothetical protein